MLTVESIRWLTGQLFSSPKTQPSATSWIRASGWSTLSTRDVSMIFITMSICWSNTLKFLRSTKKEAFPFNYQNTSIADELTWNWHFSYQTHVTNPQWKWNQLTHWHTGKVFVLSTKDKNVTRAVSVGAVAQWVSRRTRNLQFQTFRVRFSPRRRSLRNILHQDIRTNLLRSLQPFTTGSLDRVSASAGVMAGTAPLSGGR